MSQSRWTPSRWQWKTTDVQGEGQRADRAILNALEKDLGEWSGEALTCSRSRLQKLIEEGAVSVDGKPLSKSNVKLIPGSLVEIHFPEPRSLDVLPEDKPIEILYQDEHLLIVNKPPRLTVHPSETQADGTLVNILLHHIKDLSGIGGALRPGIVHRIDKDTSGALVITKTDRAHQALVETFAKHDIERVYWALAYGSPPPSAKPVKIEGNIGRSLTDRKKMAIHKVGGRHAVTYYRRVEEYGRSGVGKAAFASWLEVTLETGRTHQVRVHLNSIGHSILADPVYGTPTDRQPKWLALPEDVREAVRAMPGQALHARVLGFVHPVTGEKLRFEAELPPEFKHLLETLKKYS
jgi:23S rRNA pseudouridine1911/1915/1917 synthase